MMTEIHDGRMSAFCKVCGRVTHVLRSATPPEFRIMDTRPTSSVRCVVWDPRVVKTYIARATEIPASSSTMARESTRPPETVIGMISASRLKPNVHRPPTTAAKSPRCWTCSDNRSFGSRPVLVAASRVSGCGVSELGRDELGVISHHDAASRKTRPGSRTTPRSVLTGRSDCSLPSSDTRPWPRCLRPRAER